MSMLSLLREQPSLSCDRFVATGLGVEPRRSRGHQAGEAREGTRRLLRVACRRGALAGVAALAAAGGSLSAAPDEPRTAKAQDTRGDTGGTPSNGRGPADIVHR